MVRVMVHDGGSFNLHQSRRRGKGEVGQEESTTCHSASQCGGFLQQPPSTLLRDSAVVPHTD